jgi:hypothetical protein
MQRNDGTRARAADDTGAAAPTPLFLAYLASLGLAAAGSFFGGFGTDAVIDFLLLAAIVSGSVLVLFAVLMIWSARAGHRVAALAAARPGALVLRGARARGLRRAVRALRTDVPFVPVGLTLLADETGVELPFAVLGSGLGGLAVPDGPELEHLVCALRARRAASVDA